jgi:hypothetical protein
MLESDQGELETSAMSIFKPNLEGFGRPVYPLSNGPDDEPVSAILNEARHVFDWHKEGLWNAEYKDGFASLLIPYIRSHPKLIRRVLELDQRVFSMVMYRAVELEKRLGAEANPPSAVSS